jgi:hypothetical protein
MEIEELLRQKLQTSTARSKPSPGFEDRVRRSLTPRPRGSWRSARLLPSVVAIAALLLLVIAAIPWFLGPRTEMAGTGGAAEPSAVASEAASLGSTEAATGIGLAHGRAWNLAFDYPSTWLHYDAGYNRIPGTSRFSSQAASVALGTLGPVQQAWTGPGGTWSTSWNLTQDSVAMTFEWQGAVLGKSEFAVGSLAAAAWTSPPAESRKVTIAGLPSLFSRSSSSSVPFGSTALSGQRTIPGADEVLVWKLTSHYDVWHSYSITAAIRGPNTAELEAQVQAVMDSLRYVDPVTPLVDTAASRAAALRSYFTELAAMTDGSRDTACFPREPGVTATATITATEVTGYKLSKPLTVRCTSQVEAMPEQAWKITLTYSWDAAVDHTAGTATDVEVYSPGYGSAGNDTGIDSMPYVIPRGGGQG